MGLYIILEIMQLNYSWELEGSGRILSSCTEKMDSLKLGSFVYCGRGPLDF